MVNHGNKCMGCGGCEIICSTDAIKIKMSQDGFWRPEIDLGKCVNCGKCDLLCPVNSQQTRPAFEAFSFKSKNKEVLQKSASGGFGYEFSLASIDKLPVCSVEYDNKKAMPVHKVATNETDLEKRRNSIYLQSYTVSGFKEILKLKRGIVFGSPCQISFLNNLLIKESIREQYLLIDFFCHGVPSYNVWKKYMEASELFDKNPDVVFRSKKYGWGNFTIESRAKNEANYSDKVKNDDIFFRIFLENMVLNECCYTCPYHGNNSSADIRIGDFWGEKYKDDRDGVTGILVFTENGSDALKTINFSALFQKETISDVLSGQISNDLPIPSCRKKLLSALQTSKSLKKINSTIIFKYKLIRKINRMIGRKYI